MKPPIEFVALPPPSIDVDGEIKRLEHKVFVAPYDFYAEIALREREKVARMAQEIGDDPTFLERL